MSIFLWIPIWLLIVWVVWGVRFVEPDEIVVVYRLGRRHKIVGPGGYGLFLPGIDRTLSLTTHTHRVLVPGKKEQIVRDDDTPLIPGQVRPVRIVHASFENTLFFFVPKEDDNPEAGFKRVSRLELEKDKEKWELMKKQMEDDSLQSSLTSEVIAFVEWNHKRDKENIHGPVTQGTARNEHLFLFRENVGSVDSANKRIDGTIRGALQDLMGTVTLRNAIEAKEHIQELIKKRIEILVGEKEPEDGTEGAEAPWGINITALQIEDISPGKRVNQARADEAAAISVRKNNLEDAATTAQATKMQAEANAEATRLQADAGAAATKVSAEAEAYRLTKLGEGERDRIRPVAELMKTEEAKFVMQVETARDVLPKANFVVVPNDIGPIAGILALGSSIKSKS